ncbi:branched-chain amino acid ABC transporter permease [Pseudonocardia ailaonensis]|uniref:Branched-chain amino acid ABC transporter permease n=1 Tax=Pseudonocardia ailaonensis TaxID=367279 RepID=A0ABN2MZ67_9PSEU
MTTSAEQVTGEAVPSRPPAPRGSGRYGRVGVLLLLVVAIALPFAVPSPYVHGLLVLVVIYAINGVGYDVQLGLTGMFSMGQALVFGAGSYTVALLCTRADSTSIFIGLAAAAVVGTVVGGLIGLVGLRTEGPQFAMISLGIWQIVLIWVQNAVDLTRGPLGISLPSYGVLGFGDIGIELDSDIIVYLVGLGLLVLTVGVVRRLLRSRVGSSWLCVRENVALARAQGVSPFRARMTAAMVSSAISAVAGGLLAYSSGFVSPDNMSVSILVGAIVIVIVGGRGSVYGAVLGAILFVVLPEALRAADTLRLLVFGGVLALGVVFVPNGLWSLVAPIRDLLTRRTRPLDAGGEAR